MNLSSYLQMPPAPPATQSPTTQALQGSAAGVSPSANGISPAAGGSLGVDFSQVMAQQLQRLAPQERQNLAAVASIAPKIPEPEVNTHNSQRDSQDARHAQSAQDKQDQATNAQAADDQADAEDSSRSSAQSRQRSKGATQKSAAELAAESANNLPPTWTSVTAAKPATEKPANVTLKNTASANVAADSLQTIELSPQVRIITDPQKAPSPESLAAFAKSMGLDEAAIQNLLGEAANAKATTNAITANTAGAMPNALTSTLAQNANAVATQVAANEAAIQASVQTPVQASVQAPVQSGAGLALAATTLHAPEQTPGLSQAEMASIQQIQITVLPPATLPITANTASTPSTLDMLSLLSSGVNEQDVSALLSRFSEDGGQQGGSEQQSSEGDQHASGFAQTLGATNGANGANGANAKTPATNSAQAAANMSDVYDQLSEKMSTELAARMHKQLSDGEWKMKFGLRPANLGGVEIHLEMKDGKLDAVFHADNPLTRDLLQNSSQRLRDALENFGIHAGQVFVGQGNANGQQNPSRQAAKQGQVGDNSTSQVKGSESTSGTDTARNKANASLLDLYA
jgi:flagellar hook-length control protein FliK